MQLFTTGDVLEITGLSATTFDAWCHGGIVKAFSGGNGTGSHRQFMLPQVVGIAIGAQLRKSNRGCVLSYVGKVVAAFNLRTEEDLLKEFEAGRTHFVTVVETAAGPSLVLDTAKHNDMPNVRELYQRIVKTGQGIDAQRLMEASQR